MEYHPRSNQEAKHFQFDDYEWGTWAENTGANIKFQAAENCEPWRPFSSQLDFEIAELMQETHMNSSQQNALLALIRRCIQHPDSFTLQTSKDTADTWAAARTRTASVSTYLSHNQ